MTDCANPTSRRRFKEGMQTAAMVPLGIAWGLAGPVTYILNVVDTWHSRASVPVKLLMNLTLDVFGAAIWPFTWIWWMIDAAIGNHTPLSLL
jgi:hypothetical protein